MIAINKDQLLISIPHPEPQQHKEELIKAIAAAIRWRASYQAQYTGDDFNLMILSELLSELVNDA